MESFRRVRWIDITRISYPSRQDRPHDRAGWSPPARKIDNPPLVASYGGD